MSNPFSNEEPPALLSVSQLNRQAKGLLEGHFGFVWVEGEISNFASPSSGHWYFSLKDGSAQVRCAMFRNRNQRMRVTPGNGDAIKLRARVSLFEGRGEFQLIVEHLELAGAGALQAAFEKLKAKLHQEGLFDSQRKQALPEMPTHLGVITSPTGAALQDILTVLRRRCPSIAVSVLPVAVQGDGAAGQVVAAIERANQWHKAGKVHLDALIIGRGGGSLEDLWAFNEEIVARAIAASELPIVSAVGHEVDFSIADLAADERAPTPSAAAEMLSPDQQHWQQRLVSARSDLLRLIQSKLTDASGELTYLRLRLKHPGAQLREQAQRLDDLEQRLWQAQKNTLLRHHNRVVLLESQLQAQSPKPRLRQLQSELLTLRQRLDFAINLRLQQSREQMGHMAQLLDSVSPLATLARGYAIMTDSEGQVVSDSSSVAIGDKVQARLSGGTLGLKVTKVD
ncbi:MAG: exodeoxyribonuclease VII large subunit [Halioglobus sp.]